MSSDLIRSGKGRKRGNSRGDRDGRAAAGGRQRQAGLFDVHATNLERPQPVSDDGMFRVQAHLTIVHAYGRHIDFRRADGLDLQTSHVEHAAENAHGDVGQYRRRRRIQECESAADDRQCDQETSAACFHERRPS